MIVLSYCLGKLSIRKPTNTTVNKSLPEELQEVVPPYMLFY